MENQNINDYLKEVEECPNERLAKDVGIENNLGVIVRANREAVRDLIMELDRSNYDGDNRFYEVGVYSQFRSERCEFTIEEGTRGYPIDSLGLNWEAVSRERQQNEYSLIMFNWLDRDSDADWYNQPREVIMSELVLDNRDIANNFRDISQLLVQNRISFCIPSKNEGILGADYPKIVSYEP